MTCINAIAGKQASAAMAGRIWRRALIQLPTRGKESAHFDGDVVDHIVFGSLIDQTKSARSYDRADNVPF
ncbi:MAG: hypothetical protein E5Y89_04430 [Mesorhizobium sp.]|nr:MAG: hypothetical protein E5Y89_04430 [Mesorhizobium sp.]